MPLIVPKYQFAAMQNNLTATPNITSGGTVVTASGTVHTKGSYATVIASTSFAADGFTLLLSNTGTSSTVVNQLLDIAVGAAASEQIIISNLPCGNTGSLSGGPMCLYFPIAIPAGTRISARLQGNISADIALANIFLHGGSSGPGDQAFTGCETLGSVTASSSALAHTPGSTGVESAWANIGSTLTRDWRAFLPVVMLDTATTAYNSFAYHFEFGYSSTTLAEYLYAVNNAEQIFGPYPNIPHFAFIPSGTQMQVRAECQGAGQQLNVALVGFY